MSTSPENRRPVKRVAARRAAAPQEETAEALPADGAPPPRWWETEHGKVVLLSLGVAVALLLLAVFAPGYVSPLVWRLLGLPEPGR
jgi:hypothetical protein